LKDKYGHILAAWRNVFDRDGSCRVSWTEFQAACAQIGFKGDVAGAWRALDEDLSGFISLRELDPASHELLISFKTYVERSFGNVSRAFKTGDADGSGELTALEFRRVCRRLRWSGDPRLLFDALNSDPKTKQAGRRTLSMLEVAYLDSYGEELENDLPHLKDLQPPRKAVAKNNVKQVSPEDFDRSGCPYYCTKTKFEHKIWSDHRKSLQVQYEAREKPGNFRRRLDEAKERMQMAQTAPCGFRFSASSGISQLPRKPYTTNGIRRPRLEDSLGVSVKTLAMNAPSLSLPIL
jgi:hypothetical protein